MVNYAIFLPSNPQNRVFLTGFNKSSIKTSKLNENLWNKDQNLVNPLLHQIQYPLDQYSFVQNHIVTYSSKKLNVNTEN